MLLGVFVGFSLTACDDDDELGDPPRLFRPIAALSNKSNDIVAEWDNIKDATSYELELLKATGEVDEAGKDVFASYRKITTEGSPYTFGGVEWDEKYKLNIKAVGSNIESEFYETDDLSVLYITKMTGSRAIDNAALIQWKVDGKPITFLKVIPELGGDAIDVEVSNADYLSGGKTISNLNPETAYKLLAYSGDEQTSNTYEGRLRFTTRAPENYDEIFGAGKWLDLRGNDNPEILKEEFEQLKEYDAIILEGGFEYKVNNTIIFDKSMTFVTGLSLAGNAVFVQSGGFQAAGNVGKLKFEKINFISDKAVDIPVREQTAKGFEGRQVYNVNGSNSLIDELIFTDCRIEGFRAVIRLQGDTDGIRNITFNNCTINGVGDQGVVTTNNKAGAIMDNVTFRNSTLMNIVMLADLRSSKTPPKFIISDCTFCYAPLETTINANTPLLRFATNPVELTITNTIFGPSLATEGSGGETLKTYNAGTKGSILLNGESTMAGITNSYKTNFDWTEINEKTYPLDGLNGLSFSETQLFLEPENEVFSINQNFDGAKTAGAEKWRMP